MSGEHTYLDLAAPYALGALDPEETAAFEAHLATCAECREEVESFQRAVGLIGLAAPPVEPPPGLHERILRDAHKVRPIRSVGHRPEGDEAKAARGPGAPLDSAPVEFTRPDAGALEPPPPPEDVLVPATRRGGVPPSWLALAASLVLLAIAAALVLREAGRNRELATRLAAADARAQAAEQRLAQREEVLATLLSRELRTATLAATGQAPTMRLYWDRASNRVVVTAYELPPAPSGRTYQLWGLAPNQAPVSLGTFNTTPAGRATVALAVPAGLELNASAVTEEPAGGSAQPTTQPFLVGTWAGE